MKIKKVISDFFLKNKGSIFNSVGAIGILLALIAAVITIVNYANDSIDKNKINLEVSYEKVELPLTDCNVILYATTNNNVVMVNVTSEKNGVVYPTVKMHKSSDGDLYNWKFDANFYEKGTHKVTFEAITNNNKTENKVLAIEIK